MTNYEMVREFHKHFCPDQLDLTEWDDDLFFFRQKLIDEEVFELDEAWNNEPYRGWEEAIVKELVDVLYVTYGTLAAMGIDANEAFKRVHESNMSKLGDDGFPIRRHDGKVLKGPNYKEPNLSDLVEY